MKILALLLASLLCLSIASAVPDSVITGPYKVSFDIGLNHSDYNITIDRPVNTETLEGLKSTDYKITINNNTGVLRTAEITLAYGEEARVVPSPDDLKDCLKYMLDDAHFSNSEIANRNIDGTYGGVASYDLLLMQRITVRQFIAIYEVSFDPQHLRCMIISGYPWDEGTLQLLKTIHVEKVA